jgi:hypothetical protein
MFILNNKFNHIWMKQQHFDTRTEHATDYHKFETHLLSDKQKQNHVYVCKELQDELQKYPQSFWRVSEFEVELHTHLMLFKTWNDLI